MRGSVWYQVETLFQQSGINQIGQSKHAAKEQVRQEFESKGLYASWHDIGQNTGIFSIKTAEDYQEVWQQILEYSKETVGIRDLEKLTAAEVADFLESKVEAGVAKATFDSYAAAAEKLGVALNRYSDKFDRGLNYAFSEQIKVVRGHAQQELDSAQAARAYADPRSLIAAIERQDHQLAARIQLEAGSRVREVKVSAKDLLGLKADPVSGQQMGWYATRGKGGKDLVKMVSLGTYHDLVRQIQECGLLKVDGKAYRESIKKAAKATGQEYHGSHGLRWNYAQERYKECLQFGLSSQQTLKTVSEELGHNRLDITLHYLRS